jgi:hypothetical protein
MQKRLGRLSVDVKATLSTELVTFNDLLTFLAFCFEKEHYMARAMHPSIRRCRYNNVREASGGRI